MFLDFISVGASTPNLVRIYGTDVRDYTRLSESFHHLSAGSLEEISLKDDLSFTAEGSLDLIALSASYRAIEAKGDFITWRMLPEDWMVAAELVLPFLRGVAVGTYQWLAGREAEHLYTRDPITILLSFSESGTW